MIYIFLLWRYRYIALLSSILAKSLCAQLQESYASRFVLVWQILCVRPGNTPQMQVEKQDYVRPTNLNKLYLNVFAS